jgi:hypothetical protein
MDAAAAAAAAAAAVSRQSHLPRCATVLTSTDIYFTQTTLPPTIYCCSFRYLQALGL